MDSYKWALRQACTVYEDGQLPTIIATDADAALATAIECTTPHVCHLLCLWHIEKNVLAKTKKHFTCGQRHKEFLNQWTGMCRTTSSTQSDECKDTHFAKFADVPTVIRYLSDTWLTHKEKFVMVWTGKCLHRGNTSTFAVEGMHATLKRYLQVSTGDLHGVRERMTHMLEHQLEEHRTVEATERLRIPYIYRTNHVYVDLIGKIIVHALHAIARELNSRSQTSIDGKALPQCNGMFRATIGLPCMHELAQLVSDECISFDSVVKHWHLYYSPPLPRPTHTSNNLEAFKMEIYKLK